ncbi:MAG: thioredoxin domain-containing protein, partial [Deltaproteobacteria bacterium]|nr:thioredoxin domain-containing protein [Deltaproteobacteria bacterium]
RGQLRRHLALDAPAGRLDLRLAERMAQVVTEDFDRESGGFGQRGPKFFEPEAWRFLLQWVFYYPLPPWRTMIDVTCKQMARGGVYDQLGGGFHRYATDRMWYVPHFEKLLSTNAAMLRLYIDAFAGTKDTVYREVGDGIADYLLTVLRDPATGLFWNHQDADDPGGGEGTFYTWDKQELADVLTAEERQVVLLTYGVRDLPRDLPQAPDENVLRLAATVTEVAGALRWPPDRVTHVLEEARVKLHARRALRPAPEVESAAYVSSNGMAVAALLRGAQVLGRRQWAEAALTALERIWSAGWNKGTGMVRGWQGGRKRADGLLGDQVWTLLALLDAYEATGEGVWLERATLLAELIEERFIDPEGGGFFDRSLALRRGPWGLESDPVKNFFDRSEPAENPALAIAYDRLAYLTDNPDWRITAEGILLGLAGMHPGSVDRSLASYASAVLYHIRPPAHVVIVGLATDPVVEGLAIVARQTARPWTIVRVLTPEAAGAAPLPEAVRAQRQVAEAAGRPMAFLCVGTACAPPTADPTELDRQLASFALSH